MAQLKQFLNKAFGVTKRICQPKLCVVVTYRNSQYPSHFIEPIFRKEDLVKLKETGEAEKLAHIPVKAARSEQTSSKLYDPQLELFINYAMREGKKEVARLVVNKSLEHVKRIQILRYHKETDPIDKARIVIDPLKVFHEAVKNCKPLMILTPIKKGGVVYQVPVPVADHKATFIAMNWLIEAGKAEPKDVRFYIKLSRELVNASQGDGRVVKRKNDLHRQCEANKAYAHYRWS